MPVPADPNPRRRWRSALARATVLAVGSAVFVGAQQASAAPTGPDPKKAVGYLTAQLVDGHYYDPFNVQQADWGLTIDGALALAAQGGNDPAYVKLVDFLAANGKDQAGTDVISWTGIDTDYPDGGSIGKLALLAETAGRNPRAFAGADLVAELAKNVCAGTTPIDSSACAGKGNYAGGSSVFKQALGLIGQVRGGADSAVVAAPTEFLLGLQNADGGWPGLIPSGGAGSDVDSTSMAVMALTLVPGDTAAAAARRGIAWVAGTQLPDGAFPGYAPPGSEPAHSTNSTALALQALRLSAGDRSAQIAKAHAFLTGTQNADGGFDIDSGADFSDVRATAQAVNGVIGRSFATLLRDRGAAGHAATGAAYLVGKLTDGTHLQTVYDDGSGNVQTFVDYGLTADLALALASTNSQDAALAKVVGYLRAHVGDYVDQTGVAGGPYGGAAGKLGVLAQVTGQDPRSFGGVDLLAVLTGNVCTTGNPDPNAFDPCSAAGDFRGAYSGVSQALGVLVLGRAGVPVPAAALTRLDQLQCADGGFSSVLIAPGAACSSDVDTTGYAVQALSLQPTRQAEVARGWQYLRATQATGGGWAGAAGVNSNSTGLATQAVLALLDKGGYVSTAATLTTGGSTPAGSVIGVQAAFGFLQGLQRADGGFDVSATEAGDESTRTRATTQAVPALAGAVLTTLLDPVTPVDPPAPPTNTTTSTSATSTSGPTSSTATSSTATSSTATSPTATSSTNSTSPSATTTSAPSGSSTTSPATTPTGGSTPAGNVTASGDLASTGSPIGVIVAVAVLLLLAGLALLVGRRMTVGGDRR
jgi:hypothetical protein